MLMSSLDRIQAMMVENAESRRPLVRIALEATEVAAVSPSTDAGSVCAFSAGLDAFYTALEMAPEIDALFYMHGFEATPEDEAQLFLLLPGGVENILAIHSQQL